MTSQSALPGLTGALVDRWAGEWNDTGLWADIDVLADRFWAATGQPTEEVTAWHHLVLAVGNFKRQAGRIRIRLPERTAPAATTVERAESFDVPGTTPTLRLACEEPGSWVRLAENVTGFAVPTTTTLLTALWPERHFVADWRVRAAANALRLYHGGLEFSAGIHPDRSGAKPITFDDYALLRDWLLDAAHHTGRPLVAVERALYELSRAVKGEAGRTWAGYAAALAATLPT